MRRLLPLFVLFLTLTASAQSSLDVRILGVDSADFPTIDLTFAVRNASGSSPDALPDLQILENDEPVTITAVETIPVGVDVTFVIDANRTIGGIDLIGDVSRLEKVKQAIGTFVEQYTGLGLDRVTVVAAQEEAAQFVIEDATDAVAVREALAAYNPDPLPADAPIETMLSVAFQQAAAREPTDRYQAIVLFSDAENLAEQVDYFRLRDLAQQSDAVFFAAILGKFASDDEVASVAELYIPTGGTWVHMPQPEDFALISEIIDSNGRVRRLRFRSEVRAGGVQQVQLVVGEATAATTYEVEILPPNILFLMEDAPITRTPDAADPTLFTPTRQQVRARILFPDDHPRGLDNVRFFVDGVEQRFFNPPVYDESGLLTFDWGISAVATGSYTLEIEVTDELGLTTRSQPFAQRVVLQTGAEPTPAPTATAAAPTLVPPPLQPAIDQAQRAVDSGLVTTALAILAALLLTLLLWRLWRRRQARAAQPAAPAPAPPPVQLPANVFLEWTRDGGETQLFPINSPSVFIGSDPFRADIILTDDSISRRHARIAFEDDQFVLYDEASAYGTRVNFDPVNLRPHIVKDGDELQFGSVRTVFRIFSETKE